MRRLYLIAYDIAEPRRLNQVRELLKGYSTGGQKSVYECWCTSSELIAIRQSLEELIAAEEDRVHIFPMDARSRPHTLGIAVPPSDPEFLYFG
jgi:CRISPR-associated protein Cas2